MNTHPLSRRDFVKSSALAAGAIAFPFVAARNVLGANNKLNIACIGAGGKGEVDIGGVSTENIAFLCDVDDKNCSKMVRAHPQAKRYYDYRVMLEKEARNIDAVTVSTPDHHHAPAAILAMKLGKHVYCQKPLTHTIEEARLMTKIAREKKLATQMGNQGHSDVGTRRLVELIQAGVLGNVKEIHCWTDRPIWPQGIDRPTDKTPVPDTLDWDLWLGPAPWRPYSPAYVPFKWRGFWDFGTGALGDMACHVMDVIFFSLGLRDPLTVVAQSEGRTAESAPKWSIITYEFKGKGKEPLKMVWYDGGKKAAPELVKQDSLHPNGVIMIGDKDTLYVPSYWGPGRFMSGAKMADFKNIPETLPRPTPFDKGHYDEWIAACKGGPKALSNFDYSGPLTESVLLGNIALRTNKKIEWDAKNLKVKNDSYANHFVRKTYRRGWKTW